MSTYVMADVHGCYIEMQEMLNRIELTESDLLIMAGDYIDRGNQSFEMLKWIESAPQNVIFLRGNHEEEFNSCLQLMASTFVSKGLSVNNVDDTKAVYQYIKEMARLKGELPFDYYGTLGKLIDEKSVDMAQLIVWGRCIERMTYTYEKTIAERKCVVVHAGYIKSLDGVETDDFFADLSEFYLYARDDAYIYGGIEHGMIIAGHTPTIFDEELPYNEGNVYRSYDEIQDCIFYNIDCGCAYRKKHPDAKLACIRIEDEEVFYI